MRKYAYLKEPYICYDTQSVYKIMLYETDGGYCLFMYCDRDAVMCSFDSFYESSSDLFEEWNELIDEQGWIDIDDPLPDCQHDAFLPIRVKGRNEGKPEWGKYEILKDGKWIEYNPQK